MAAGLGCIGQTPRHPSHELIDSGLIQKGCSGAQNLRWVLRSLGGRRMAVIVEFSGQIKRAAGMSSHAIETGGTKSLSEIVREIGETQGDPLRNLLLDEGGQIQKSLLVFVGDKQVRWSQDCEVQDGDTITLLSPISGG